METVSQGTLSKRSRLDAATYSSAETARLFGVGYTTLNEQIKAGAFPVTPLKIGRQYRFPKAIVDRMLGILVDSAEPSADNAA
ncbi:hypothetical protein BH23CHL4_BH23CHL4_29790 [soil metagenome]